MDPKDRELAELRVQISALAMLCGMLIRAMSRHGVMTEADMEALLAAMEAGTAGAELPAITQLLDHVRWAVEAPGRNSGAPPRP